MVTHSDRIRDRAVETAWQQLEHAEELSASASFRSISTGLISPSSSPGGSAVDA
jgi:hypothetical protein